MIFVYGLHKNIPKIKFYIAEAKGRFYENSHNQIGMVNNKRTTPKAKVVTVRSRSRL
jgi:hypothetical protein